MLRAVESTPKGHETKQDSKLEEARRKKAPRKIRVDRLITDTSLAATCAKTGMLGTDDQDLAGQLGDQLCNSLWTPEGMSAEDFIIDMQAALRAMKGIAPRDEMEGMLAVQMIATHNAAMECFRRAMLSNQTPVGCDLHFKHAEKLIRIFREHMEALQRIRTTAQSKPRRKQDESKSKGQKTLKKVA